MIEFEQALGFILKNTGELSAGKVSIEDSIGRVLTEDIYSAIEMPPFNKSAMDGYAVRMRDVKNVPVRLKCIGFIQAGETFRKKVGPSECVKIMTGAGLPKGVDSVVMVEDTERFDDYVEIKESIKKWKNVCLRGEDIKRKEKVLGVGRAISVGDIALLATVGRRFVKAARKPRVGVLSTGGEIVPAGRRLQEGKIYNSNGPQLLALLKSDGINARYLGIAKDRPEELTNAIKKGLENDILLISGGVSVGDYDFVPSVLKKLGVKKIFHNVRTKPGKPLFFGTRKNTIVFGIPGNPVSNFLAYHVYIRAALYKMTGKKPYKPEFEKGIIEKTFHHKAGRKHFVPVKIIKRKTRYYVTPISSHGSADILALSRADGFMVVDRNRSCVKAKSRIEFTRWKNK